MRRTTVMWQSHGCSRRTSDSVIPPPPRIVTRAPSRLRPCGGVHVVGPGVGAEAAQAGEGQRERQLGDRLGVDALAARPLAVVVDEVDEVLDAGERQLHPAGVGRRVERRGERVGVAGVGPHDAPRPRRAATTCPPPSLIASAIQAGAPSGARAIRGASGLGMVTREASARPRRSAEPGPAAVAGERAETRMAMATSMIIVASTWTCGGISTFAESKISRGNVDTLPAMNDVMM